MYNYIFVVLKVLNLSEYEDFVGVWLNFEPGRKLLVWERRGGEVSALISIRKVKYFAVQALQNSLPFPSAEQSR